MTATTDNTCGDSANGAPLVVRAMASGRQTAQKVDTFLRQEPVTKRIIFQEKVLENDLKLIC